LPKTIVQEAKKEKAVEEIVNGRLGYTPRCGWVDWGHARGDGPEQLLEHILKEQPSVLSKEDNVLVKEYITQKKLSPKKYYPIVYYQQMKKQEFGVEIAVGTRSIYIVQKVKTKKLREGIAWRIFKEVSVNFERLQGTAPYNIIPSTAASSFGIGDLTGNKVSFYTALRDYDSKDLRRICGSSTINGSLNMFERQHQDPSRQNRWKKIPQLISVPRIPRGVVRTVLDNKLFYGEY